MNELDTFSENLYFIESIWYSVSIESISAIPTYSSRSCFKLGSYLVENELAHDLNGTIDCNFNKWDARFGITDQSQTQKGNSQIVICLGNWSF